ncbi:MAG TPA: ATP-binding cassette domain-containing protein [Anaerolineae bacterium]|nr:ATP-binding cassette domain-containing protein [Anaerolineae bacterium]HID85289.1 ATP-binding cassette domain-containing protein [Anaerolineales bacterium]HIQ08557.1 ATP-binding cassette domain-containing protein [Anaerolineaceae bacterium]
MSSAIVVRNLHKTYRSPQRAPGLRAALRHLVAPRYRTVQALQGVSFTIRPGEAVGYLGPNGAGKTTTLKILAGVLFPDAGEVEVLCSVPWKGETTFKKQSAFVMGRKGQLWWDLPALDLFHLFREMYEVPLPVFRRRLDDLAGRFRVTDLLSVPVRNLSLGERMKMELIAALLHGPQVLFLDEPTLGLDVMAQHEIRALLRDYVRQQGLTLLMASHYMRDVEAICDRIILLDAGRIRFDGPLSDLKARYAPFREVRATLTTAARAVPAAAWLVERAGPRLRWRVPREQVPMLLQQLTAQNEVVDLSVQEPALADVLREAFAQNSAGR